MADDANQGQQPNYEEKIQNLEKKLGELSSTLEQQNEFIQGASVVINTVAYNPELREAFQGTLKKQYGVVEEGKESSQQPKQELPQNQTPPVQSPKIDPITRKVEDIASSQRESIIAQFEKEYGISDLKPEDQKEARRKVESYLNDFGWSVTNVPLANLKQSLDKAWVGTNVDKLKEEGKLDAFAKLRANQQGQMATLAGGEIPSQGEQTLSKEQQEWIRKLGVDEEGAKKTYFEQDKEKTRVPSSEKKT